MPPIAHPLESAAPSGQTEHLVSLTQAYPLLDTAAFLQQAYGNERFYWSSPHDTGTFAGFGIAKEITAWGAERFKNVQDKVRRLFQEATLINDHPLAGPRLFGGFAFRDDFVPDNTWSVYAPAYFVLPHYQIAQLDGQTWLTININIPSDEDPQTIIPYLKSALDERYQALAQAHPSKQTHAPQAVEVSYPMPYESWDEIITHATEQIKQGALEKVVLSRVCEIRFDQRTPIDNALAFLNEQYSDCYRFLFEPQPYRAFYGATPELLAHVNGHHLETMGLAGSIRRGKTAAEDATLRQQILNDPKERLEHDLVVQALRQNLAPLTDSAMIPDMPEVLQLNNIQHLHTPITGKLKNAEGILPVVEQLHPTPALGGSPREAAMQFIRETEPVPRGWYAAPIGWINANLDGLFSVAIRSAVSEEKRVWLYAGVGIVADSVPQKEWDETALKFRPMLGALGIQEQVHV